jgi:hypothetical protein
VALDWTAQLLEQLTWDWTHHARPRLDGLTDDEYLAALVLHINREAIHHLAEVLLLRDLYRAR